MQNLATLLQRFALSPTGLSGSCKHSILGVRPILYLVGWTEGAGTQAMEKEPQVEPSADPPCQCLAVGQLHFLGNHICFHDLGLCLSNLPRAPSKGKTWLIPASDLGMQACAECSSRTPLWRYSLSKLPQPDLSPAVRISLQHLFPDSWDTGTH